jgi:hypothetical protein
VEAVARMMALANLSASTLGRMPRACGRQARPWLTDGPPPRDAALLPGGPAVAAQRGAVRQREQVFPVPVASGDEAHGAGRDQRRPAPSRSSMS